MEQGYSEVKKSVRKKASIVIFFVLMILGLGAAMPVQAGSGLARPKIVYSKKVTNKTQKVKLTTSVKGGKIYYTTDGSTPKKGAKGTKKYSHKIKIKHTTTIKCRVYKGKKKSKVKSVKIRVLTPVKISNIKLVSGGVFLEWDKSDDAKGYRVYRKKGLTGKWECVKKYKSKNDLSYVDRKVDWKSKYYYYISAYRGKVRSLHKNNTKSISTKHTHQYVGGKILRASTCSKKGLQKMTCSICKKTKEGKLAKLPHKTKKIRDGYYTVEVCKDCGEETERYLAKDIPDYWEDEITFSMDTVKKRGDLPCFAYFTDTHWSKNTGHSPAIVNYVVKDLNLPFAVFGGDAITAYHTSVADAKAELKDFFGKMQVRLFSTTGNHDWNSSSNPDTSTYLSREQLYELMYAREAGYANLAGGAEYSYTDDTAHRIRYISFGYDERQPVEEETLSWVEARVKELSEDWTVVLFSHAYWHYKKAGTPLAPQKAGTALAESLLKIQRESDATIALWLVGHVHRDNWEVLGDYEGSLLVVSVNCDAYKLSTKWGGLTMKKDTDTEQVIELVQLDTAEKIVYLTRIGAGDDRAYSYKTPEKPEDPTVPTEPTDPTPEDPTPEDPTPEETTLEETSPEESSPEESSFEESSLEESAADSPGTDTNAARSLEGMTAK